MNSVFKTKTTLYNYIRKMIREPLLEAIGYVVDDNIDLMINW